MAAMTALTAKTSSFAGRTVAARNQRVQARSAFVVRATANPSWFPGKKVPDYLAGLPGSYGFDPLNLGTNPDALKWYVQGELVNARWAMLGAAGILIPALLTKAGILSVPAWYEAGKVAQDSSSVPFGALVASEILFFNYIELKRYQDIVKPGSQAEPGSFLGFETAFKGTGEPGYPGNVFDPLGFSKSASFAKYKENELRNGRLAMVAMAGFFAQAAATGKDPLTNLGEHIADPWNVNFTTNGVSLPFL